MPKVTYKQLGQLSFIDDQVYSVLPEHPIWSRAAECINFSFVDRICAPLYSSRGPRPYAPSLKFKLHIVQRYYNLSDREMEERVIGDLFIKRFLGLPVDFIGFDHSTIGLDRDRVGAELFDTCNHYILAQARQKGLWGDKKDIWIVDSFAARSNVTSQSSYRLIKQAIVRLLNHLKRAHRTLFGRVQADLDLGPLTAKLPPDATPADWAVSYSQLAVLGYGLLHWFESESVRPVFWSWADRKRQLTSLERQALLYRILRENVYPEDPNDPHTPFKKIERQKRRKDRILSAVDPDVRNGAKTKTQLYFGDKIQVVTSARHRLVLNAEPIAANEPDGARLQELVSAIRTRHDVRPEFVLADSAYGFGNNRRKLAGDNIQLVAPLKKVGDNPKGLLSSDQFFYDDEANTVTCPTGQLTDKYYDRPELEGRQYIFAGSTCKNCALKDSCTEGTRAGRSIFISDYYTEFQAAKAYNETDQGKALLRMRSEIEQKNHEMKNHNGLGRNRLRTREKRRIDVKLVGIVVNLKQMLKIQYGSITLGFKRKKPPGTRLLIS